MYANKNKGDNQSAFVGGSMWKFFVFLSGVKRSGKRKRKENKEMKQREKWPLKQNLPSWKIKVRRDKNKI